MSNEKLAIKTEAGYLLPYDVRASGGSRLRAHQQGRSPGSDVVVAGISGLRGSTHEVTYRGELRRSVSETLPGSVGPVAFRAPRFQLVQPRQRPGARA